MQLLTIGHSTHSFERFIEIVKGAGVTAIVDVRSSPFSRYSPHFNRDALAAQLRKQGVHYLFLGRELGARRDERECYVGRQARYDRIAQLPLFRVGVERVLNGCATHTVALMCAEKDPITCHRMVLVSRAARQPGLKIDHVREDGSIESNTAAENRMLEFCKLPTEDLFQTRQSLVERAYDLQALRIAWQEPLSGGTGGLEGFPDSEETHP